MSVQCLPQSTIKLIGSSQVITSVSAAVKELIENSLDAGALSIDVKLENHGMDKIEVRDDGSGIPKEDVAVMCKKSYTSKITSFSDLDSLISYGFRGEALNALCNVSKLSITTKTNQDTLAYNYQFDNDGNIQQSKPSHIIKGTIIVAEGLFRNLPVRRQFLTNGKRRNEDMKKVESIVKSFAIVHPKLRITLTHNKFLIWQKNSVSNLKLSLSQAVPPTVISQLDSIEFIDDNNVELYMILPRKDCNISVACYSSRNDAFYIYINSRPVKHKEIEKTVENELFQYFGNYIPSNKYPLCLLSIKLPPDGLDVNLEPNKTRLIVKELDYLTDKIKAQFLKHYTGIKGSTDPTTPVDIKLPKRKLESDDNNINFEQNDNIKIPRVEENQIASDCSKSSQINLTSETINSFDLKADPETTESCIEKNSEINCPDNLSTTSDYIHSTSNSNSENTSVLTNYLSNKINEDSPKINSSLNSKTYLSVDNRNSQEDIFDDIKDKNNFFNSNSDETCSNSSKNAEHIKSENIESQTTNCSDWGDDNFTAQEIDELEIMLAQSQSSVLVEPDINSDCIDSDKSQNSEKQLLNNIQNSNRNDTICEFLNGLPVRDDNEMLYSPIFKNKNLENLNSDEKSINTVKIVNDSLIIADDDNKKEHMNLEDVTLSQWSRGHVLNTDVVPVNVQAQAELNEECISNNDESNTDEFLYDRSMDANSTSQMDRSASSQMGCKNMSAFTRFAKEMRSMIIKQSPGISFTRVAAELASRWRELGDDEKEKYQELAEQDKMKDKRINLPEQKFKQTNIKAKTLPSNESTKGLKKNKYHKVVEMNCSLHDVRERLYKRSSLSSDNYPHIINKLEEDLYLYIADNTISILNSSRLNEVVTYYNNMSNMTVPLKVLENNISVNCQDIGEKNWHTLQCLETSIDFKNNTIVISNEIISKNGFRIEVTDGVGGKEFQITDVAANISFYGIEDLKELLDLIDKNGFICNLIHCRPLKITSYIKGETIRNCLTTSFNFENTSRDSLFNYWFKNVNSVYPNCLHHKPVSKFLYKLK